MKEAELLKLETRSDAEVPQEEKYPSGTVIATGFALGDETNPYVKKGFPVYIVKKNSFRGFKTSNVTEIEEETPNFIQFKTRNSRYKLIWSV